MDAPARLRVDASRFREAAKREDDPHLRRFLANHAFALAQLAERLAGLPAEHEDGIEDEDAG